MGEANQRGSLEERVAEARDRKVESSEVVIGLDAVDGKLAIAIKPRDAEPNQDSPALIFAGFLNANFDQLADEAWQAYLADKAPPQPAVEVPSKDIVILAADGSRLQ